MNHHPTIKKRAADINSWSSYTCLVCVRFDPKHKLSPPKAIIKCDGVSLHAATQTDMGGIMLSEKQSQGV